jgi:arginase
MSGPYVTIDLEKIEENARVITSLCSRYGIEVTGVTKVTCGMPQVAAAMIRGGVVGIGESRMENIRRLKVSGILSTASFAAGSRDHGPKGNETEKRKKEKIPIMLLRIPPLSLVDEIVTSVDISLNSELSVIRGLSDAAERRGLVHDIILMVDLGDLREGIWPDDLIPTVEEVVSLSGVRIIGIGTNLSCYGGVIPTEENMGALVDYADEIERKFPIELQYISGGNSSALTLISEGKMPKRVNHMRIGEAILLGRETIERRVWPETSQDAFTLVAEVIELKEKPSLPIGEIGQDAFGGKRSSGKNLSFLRHLNPFNKISGGNLKISGKRREMVRVILNIGREDVDVCGISPIDERLKILGSSSDHLIVDVTKAGRNFDELGGQGIAMGGELGFLMNYAALLAVMTSSYVEKRPTIRKQGGGEMKGVTIIGVPCWVGSLIPGTEGAPTALRRAGIREKIESLGLEVEDAGDIDIEESEKKISGDNYEGNISEVVRVSKATEGLVEDSVKGGRVPLVLGGDDSTSLGVFSGLSVAMVDTGPFGVIWLDAHGDFLTPQDNDNLKISRTVLASALGYGDERLRPAAGETGRGNSERSGFIYPENVVIVGLRDVEREEAGLISESGVSVFTMEDIDTLGMKEVIYRAIRTAGAGTSGIYLSFDMDVVDAQTAPGVNEPSSGGLTYRETHLAMELISQSGLLVAVDVVGINPERDPDGRTVKEAVEFILSVFGKKILGRSNVS